MRKNEHASAWAEIRGETRARSGREIQVVLWNKSHIMIPCGTLWISTTSGKDAAVKPLLPDLFDPIRLDELADACPLPRERHPEAYALYCQHFVDPFAGWAFNVKEGYDGTFRRRKGWRKDGTGYNLPFGGSLRDDALSKNLDRHAWNDRQHALGRTGKVIRKPLWVALLPGKTTAHVVVDLDNHNDVGWVYRRDDPTPVASITLPYLRRLKTVHDLGPQVIASSSRNLGTYAFFKLPEPVETRRAFDFFKRKLGEVGLGETEVYPVPPTRKGEPDPQCHRRPFGEGCWTYTPGGLVKHWVEQTLHFDQPGPLPSFSRLVEMMLSRVEGQLDEWAQFSGEGVVAGHRARQRDETARIREWVDSGCPEVIRTALVATSTARCDEGGELLHPKIREQTGNVSRMPPEWRERTFIARCWELATNGLPEEDSFTWAIYELAKWLAGVECYYLPSEIRANKVHSLLSRFIHDRHNGHCSRVADGRHEEVHRQVARIIAKAEQKAEEPFFQRLRHAYRRGYRKPLVVEHILTGEGKPNRYYPSAIDQPQVPPMVPFYSEQLRLDAPLPQEVECRIVASAGRTTDAREKLLSFARKFANLLVSRGGKARVHVETLSGLLGYADPKTARSQVARYKKRLGWLIVETDGYVVGEKSKEYTLVPFEPSGE